MIKTGLYGWSDMIGRFCGNCQNTQCDALENESAFYSVASSVMSFEPYYEDKVLINDPSTFTSQ